MSNATRSTLAGVSVLAAAATYLRTTIPGRFANAPQVDPAVRFGSGSMRGTILDLAAWYHAFFAGQVIRAGSVREMMTPATLNDGRLTGGAWGTYGYGIEIAT